MPWIGADGTGAACTGIAAGAAAGTATVNICPGPTPGGTATCPGCYGFEKRNQKRAPPPDTEMAPRTEEPPVVQGNVVETVAAEKK